jgi:hypothetical protein
MCLSGLVDCWVSIVFFGNLFLQLGEISIDLRSHWGREIGVGRQLFQQVSQSYVQQMRLLPLFPGSGLLPGQSVF